MSANRAHHHSKVGELHKNEKPIGSGGPYSQHSSHWGDIAQPVPHRDKSKVTLDEGHPLLREEVSQTAEHKPKEAVLERHNIGKEAAGEVTNLIWEHGGEQVYISGDFNRWKPQLMKKSGETIWNFPIRLDKGEFLFHFWVDGEWKVDPSKATKLDEEKKVFNVIHIF